MKTYAKIGRAGSIYADLIQNETLGRRIQITVNEGAPDSLDGCDVMVWEQDNAKVFEQVAGAFGIDIGEPVPIRHTEKMPA